MSTSKKEVLSMFVRINCFATWTLLLFVVCGLTIVTDAASAQAWGTLRGRFVYDGKPPVRQKCTITKDTEVCTAHHPLVEDLIVDGKGGVANIGVWLLTEDVAVHPSYAETAKATVTLDNKHCRFEPHFAAIRVGQTLRLMNSDPVTHNVNGGSFRKNAPFNDNLPPKATVDKVFTAEERLGVPLSCGSHGWMKSYVLVKATPYVAISKADGTFEIANLPAGAELEFKTWHAPSGYISEPSVGGKAKEWSRGQFTITIAEGDNDMGDILLSPAELE